MSLGRALRPSFPAPKENPRAKTLMNDQRNWRTTDLSYRYAPIILLILSFYAISLGFYFSEHRSEQATVNSPHVAPVGGATWEMARSGDANASELNTIKAPFTQVIEETPTNESSSHLARTFSARHDALGSPESWASSNAPMHTAEEDTSSRPQYKVYKRRWFGLVQLALLNIVISWDVCRSFDLTSHLPHFELSLTRA